MFKYLTNKDDKTSKEATDFYKLCIYSQCILNSDWSRLKEYTKFKQQVNMNTQTTSKENIATDRLIKTCVGLFLMYRFKSVLIVPVFFVNVYLFEMIINKFSQKRQCDNCFFCRQNGDKLKTFDKFKKYQQILEYCRKKNVYTIDELEKELDRMLIKGL